MRPPTREVRKRSHTRSELASALNDANERSGSDSKLASSKLAGSKLAGSQRASSAEREEPGPLHGQLQWLARQEAEHDEDGEAPYTPMASARARPAR